MVQAERVVSVVRVELVLKVIKVLPELQAQLVEPVVQEVQVGLLHGTLGHQQQLAV